MPGKLILIAVFLLTLGADSAFAQSGSSSQRRACNGDAHRFCKRVMRQGEMAIYSCLQGNAARLSRRCRKVIVGY
jgi:hypothetical protein